MKAKPEILSQSSAYCSFLEQLKIWILKFFKLEENIFRLRACIKIS